MMAAMQQLGGLSSAAEGTGSGELVEKWAYNAPSQNMENTMNFFLGDRSIRKTIGSGKHRTTTSSAMLLPTCAKPIAFMSYRILPPYHDCEMGSTRVITSCS